MFSNKTIFQTKRKTLKLRVVKLLKYAEKNGKLQNAIYKG